MSAPASQPAAGPQYALFAKMNQPRRVLHVLPTLALGGAESFVHRLARAQREAGTGAPAVVALHAGGPVEALLGADGIPFEVIGIRRRSVRRPLAAWRDGRALVRGVLAALRAHRAELVQTHLDDADWIGLAAARRAGVPCAVTYHNPTLAPHGRTSGEWRSRLRRRLRASTLARADAVVAVGEEVRQALLASPGVRPERLHLVPSGIVARPLASLEQRAAWRAARAGLVGDAEPLLGSVGRLVANKGHDLVLDALARVRRSHPRTRLWIAGEGPERVRLEERAHQLGVAPAVCWLGARHDIEEWLAISDLFVTGSRYEGLGLAAAEAQHAGLAVVGFRVAGIWRVVADGETGLLVADGDSEALARAIEALVADPARRAAMGAAGRERSAAYTIERAREAAERLYERLLAGAGSS